MLRIASRRFASKLTLSRTSRGHSADMGSADSSADRVPRTGSALTRPPPTDRRPGAPDGAAGRRALSSGRRAIPCGPAGPPGRHWALRDPANPIGPWGTRARASPEILSDCAPASEGQPSWSRQFAQFALARSALWNPACDPTRCPPAHTGEKMIDGNARRRRFNGPWGCPGRDHHRRQPKTLPRSGRPAQRPFRRCTAGCSIVAATPPWPRI